MTFDDDFMRFVFDHGYKDITCKAAGVSWPPPVRTEAFGFTMVRTRMSTLSDAQRQETDRVLRAAEYVVDKEAVK